MMRSLVLLVLLAGCAAVPQSPPPGMPQSVGAPRVNSGDSWVYQQRDGYTALPRGTVRYSVVEVRDASFVVELSGDGAPPIARETYTRDWNWIEKPIVTGVNYRYEPAYPAFAFPLEAGRTWKSTVNATDPRTGKTHRMQIHGAVIGWERVKVPAGEFDTLHVRRLVYAGDHDHFRGETHIAEHDWYAPAIGQFVKHQHSSGYRDNMRGSDGLFDDGGWINGDWIIAELVSYQAARR
ncbi:MAG: hypothetical protein HY323_18135 [Betaproteobacteria bacterium]|nr:hypothetical protein [Betaproteobacteria bacterium]MBI3938896.1 hypothetical protein [Betaproteobacteria bacterium]